MSCCTALWTQADETLTLLFLAMASLEIVRPMFSKCLSTMSVRHSPLVAEKKFKSILATVRAVRMILS